MGTPISVEIRERAVAAYESGAGSLEYVSELFQIGTASLKRWRRMLRETGFVKPLPRRYGPSPHIDEYGLSKLKSICEAQPDLTLPELRDKYNRQCHDNVSESTIGRAVRERLNLPRKKRVTTRSNKIRRASKH